MVEGNFVLLKPETASVKIQYKTQWSPQGPRKIIRLNSLLTNSIKQQLPGAFFHN